MFRLLKLSEFQKKNSALLFSFSRISKKDIVPKLLKDPRFTRTGVLQKKKKSLQYDLSQSHIKNPHLYYDEKKDKIEKRHLYKARKQENNIHSVNVSELNLESLISELKNEDLLANGSSRILNIVIELENRYKNIEFNELIVHSLKSIRHKFHFFNLREFGIYVTLSRRYLTSEKQIWKEFGSNLNRMIEKMQYFSINPVENQSKTENLIFIFKNVVTMSREFGLDIEKIIENMNSLFQNKLDKVLDPSLLLMYISTITQLKIDKGQEIFKIHQQKLISNFEKFNETDLVILLKLIRKNNVDDQELIKKIEKKYVSFLDQNKSENLSKESIKNFAVFCQLISSIKSYKPTTFCSFATNFFLQKKDSFNRDIDLSFLLESFSKMKTNNKEIYKIIPKKLESIIKNSKFEVVIQVLKTVQRKYEYYNLVFLGNLAQSLDNFKDIERSSGENLVSIVNLMNIIKEKDRSCVFQSYDSLIAMIEQHNNTHQEKK